MKNLNLLLLVILFVSCKEQPTSSKITEEDKSNKEIMVSEFQSIIDSAAVKGSILVYDLKEDTYFSNDFQWARGGHLPASTYKITNSIIALETGVVENDSTLFQWDGAPRRLKVWEQDLVFRDAFHFSCVPCYQEVARNIGSKRMNHYLKKLDYGAMQVDSTNIDMFWLQGESKISQFQQVNYLKRLYQSQLSISKRTDSIIKRMMVIEDKDDYKLSGKTGWSIRNGNNNGWFVGYLEAQNNTYFFAANVEPEQDFDMSLFPMIRKDIVFKAFQQMKLTK